MDMCKGLYDKTHPLIEILFEISEYKSKIIKSLFKYNSIETRNEYYFVDKLMKERACDLEKVLLQKSNQIDIKSINETIATKVPDNYRNKLLMALKTGGISGLKKVVHNLCNSKSDSMALMVLDLSGQLFPLNNFTDYEKQSRVFTFIQWIDSVLKEGLPVSSNHFIVEDSAEQVRPSQLALPPCTSLLYLISNQMLIYSLVNEKFEILQQKDFN